MINNDLAINTESIMAWQGQHCQGFLRHETNKIFLHAHEVKESFAVGSITSSLHAGIVDEASPRGSGQAVSYMPA